MKYAIAFLAAAVIIFSQNAFSQKIVVRAYMQPKHADVANDTIYYDFRKPLQWSDFQGTPDLNHFGGAVTASGFAFDSEMSSDGRTVNIDVAVYTYFSKKSSWKKPAINSPYHLLHEQHHFDITRLGAERLVDELSKANFTEANYKTLMASIFQKVYKENNELQIKYDSETAHSLDTAKQSEWNDRIALAIKKLQDELAQAH